MMTDDADREQVLHDKAISATSAVTFSSTS